jgi:hypothetical protein
MIKCMRCRDTKKLKLGGMTITCACDHLPKEDAKEDTGVTPASDSEITFVKKGRKKKIIAGSDIPSECDQIDLNTSK